jgi:diguanylate cyclase (GGDEF)-like protein
MAALLGVLGATAVWAAVALLARRGSRRRAHADEQEHTGEQARRREQAEALAGRLRTSEARRAALMESSLDALLLVDGLGRVTELNAAGRALFGCDDRGPLTLTSLFARELPFETSRFGIAAHAFETTARRPNRSEFPVEVRVAPVRDPHVHGLHALAVRDLSARRRFESSMGSMSFEDPLTHLYNSFGFMMMATQQLKNAARSGHTVVVVTVDGEDLERIRGDFGRANRDRALVELATALRSSFRETDVVGRLADGQFAVLATETVVNGVDRALERFSMRLATRNADGDLPWRLGASLGWWRTEATQGITLADLLGRINERLPVHHRRTPLPHLSRP